MIIPINKFIFTFGRFNPLTRGHQRLFDYMEGRCDIGYIFVSPSEGGFRNPLLYSDRVKYIQQITDVPVITDSGCKSPFDVLRCLSAQGFKDVEFIVGEDRVEAFETAIRPYIKSMDSELSYNFESFKVTSSGPRTLGISGTDLRNFARNEDFANFFEGCPTNMNLRTAKEIYLKIIERSMAQNILNIKGKL